VLIVTSKGTVEGNVRARSVTIEGHLNGTIAAIDVSLSPTAIVNGEIVAEKIQVDFGAQVEGRLTAKGEAKS
jgi:cytoskeletal protein CcmA (bactofilin family)